MCSSKNHSNTGDDASSMICNRARPKLFPFGLRSMAPATRTFPAAALA
jgi:hypothetical protein